MANIWQRGFTLIEMLVALALMAMIAVILLTSLQLGGHTWQRVMRVVSGTEDVAQAQEILRLRLSSLYPDDQLSGAARQPFLASDGGSLAFYGAAPEAAAGGFLRYQISLSSEARALEMRSWPDKEDSSNALSDSSPETLLPDVIAMSVQFLLQEDPGPGRWVDRWNLSTVPRLIRIDVAFAPNDKRRWPPLYIEPRVDTPASCVFDVVSRRCRSRS